MADKEATVYVLDLGSTMADCNNGRTESDLDWGLRYVWDKISTTVAASRKTWCIGVLGLRTDETDNPLSSNEGYENISILKDLGPMTLTEMKTVQKSVVPNDTNSGDAVSAIIAAIEMIEKFTKKLKYKRRIILVTDGKGPIDADDFDDVAEKMNTSGIELVVLGVDFDDAEYGFKEEDKTKLKKKNEKLLRELTEQVEGSAFGTMAEAIGELDVPRLKPYRPYKSYDGLLTLGNSVSISVERYFKTHHAIPPSASMVVTKAEDAVATQSSYTVEDDSATGFSAVRHARTYKVADPKAPGGKTDVEFENLAKGYEYGRTAVHISESEHNITKLESKKSFEIIGFVPSSKFEPFATLGECCQTVASRFNEASALALSSLINALWEVESYAVGRLVAKDGKDPQLVLLMPNPIAPECLYDVPLPFAEDVRQYPFPPLDRVITISGATLTKHRNLPTEELADAMSEYVDAMDLTTAGEDGDEYAAIEETYNPAIHRINQAIRTRSTRPGPIDAIPKGLLKYSNPPEGLVKRVKDQIDELIEVAEVKKVPPKVKGKRKQHETVKPLSGLDIDALLEPAEEGAPAALISADNSVPEFKRALGSADTLEAIEGAARQMGQIVRDLITNSLGDSGYDRAAENMRVLREELINVEEPETYNTFIKDLKKGLLSGELGGDRREMWWQVRMEKLGLVSVEQSEVSDVSEKEAAEFFSTR